MQLTWCVVKIGNFTTHQKPGPYTRMWGPWVAFLSFARKELMVLIFVIGPLPVCQHDLTRGPNRPEFLKCFWGSPGNRFFSNKKRRLKLSRLLVSGLGLPAETITQWYRFRWARDRNDRNDMRWMGQSDSDAGKKCFLSEKNVVFSEKNVFFRKKMLFFRRKMFFFGEKCFFWKKKCFVSEKNVFFRQKMLSVWFRFASRNDNTVISVVGLADNPPPEFTEAGH
jgi:hypothetical protein